ncbi:hypothetical protein CEXT_526511 [Caerostris extrusa]|uniref:Uncharacterized protein n=1 Tax=Caerostris extrusa TaxID=172846 RepID=A0AAV4Q1L3_CAEEX|nr:hypothetical protein CEXT_526511 [Caerostris extrusa]
MLLSKRNDDPIVSLLMTFSSLRPELTGIFGVYPPQFFFNVSSTAISLRCRGEDILTHTLDSIVSISSHLGLTVQQSNVQPHTKGVALHSGVYRNRSWKDMLLVRIMVVEYAEVAELSRLFRLVVDR